MLATTSVDNDQNQVAEPSDQPMLESHSENQLPAFNPDESPRIPTPHPLGYDPWFDVNRSYSALYPPKEELKPLEPDPWKGIDRTFFEMNSRDPYEEPVPPPKLSDPPTSRKHVQELHQYGENLVNEGIRIRQIGERLVLKMRGKCNTG
ncbi:hypothetical protein Hanom_Chr08g00747071 [Helianthus anomalus]